MAAALERAIALWGFRARRAPLADAVGRALFRGDLDDARAQCERSSSPAAEVFLAALVGPLAARRRAGRPAGPPSRPPSGWRRRWSGSGSAPASSCGAASGSSATVGATAPFIGLFGTVVGIMNAFQHMAQTGQGGFAVVAAGISEALITTAAGIAVAVLAVVLFNAINTHVQRLTLQLRLLTEEYLELVKELAARGRRAAGGAPRRARRRRGGLSRGAGRTGRPRARARSDGGLFADINITPLTDIFLVLLIIFMVTTTAIAEHGADKGGFKVTLPKGGKGDATAPRDSQGGHPLRRPGGGGRHRWSRRRSCAPCSRRPSRPTPTPWCWSRPTRAWRTAGWWR